MSYICSWCYDLANLPLEKCTHQGEAPAFDDNTGEPICEDCADEQDGVIDVLETAPHEAT